ncbi:MAG TPA: iron-containing redox enzyme family protein [Myxococcales bacterium]|nr:iron-containing redox enzyme family protein [Myxococcales bacterium]
MDVRDLHLRLLREAQRRLRPSFPEEPPPSDEAELRALEAAFVEEERAAVKGDAEGAPLDPAAFVAWFESLRETGPGQGDALFPFLAEEASLEEMRWFLRQEVAGEAGFDDLVALTQLRMPERAKLELARNYWDEMGRGRASAMHGPLLAGLARTVGAEAAVEDTVWESLALANLLVAMAFDRRYAFHSVGALGAIELTAPTRVGYVDRGLARLGVSKAARRYFSLHATLDVQHSAAWNREVMEPLVAADSRCARAIAEGALMRLRAGARCFARYRAELRVAIDPPPAAAAGEIRSSRAGAESFGPRG